MPSDAAPAAPTLRTWLSVPYVLAVESFESASGQWLRRAFYPEIPAPDSIGENTVDVIDRAELHLLREIVRRWAGGEALPMPRPPVAAADVEGILREHGLDDVVGLLDVTRG
jgi:hypothetical protein